MPKGGFTQDTFEKLAELGATTAKKAGKAVAQTFSPLKLGEQLAGNQPETEEEKLKKESNKDNNHTPLKFDELQKKYEDQDQVKLKQLRNTLFQRVKEGDKKAAEEKKKKEEERKEMFEREETEKKRKEEQKKLQEQQTGTPRGKERKSLFSPKRKSQEKHAELKPGSGKQ